MVYFEKKHDGHVMSLILNHSIPLSLFLNTHSLTTCYCQRSNILLNDPLLLRYMS